MTKLHVKRAAWATARFTRSLVIALALAIVLHLLADYFGWKIFTEVGGQLVRASRGL